MANICGKTQIARYLRENQDKGFGHCNDMNKAAECGNLSCVKDLHEKSIGSCTTDAMNFAACNGYLEVFKYLYNNRSERCTTLGLEMAAANGHLDIVKILCENRIIEELDGAINSAKQNEHKIVYNYLLETQNKRNATSSNVPSDHIVRISDNISSSNDIEGGNLGAENGWNSVNSNGNNLPENNFPSLDI
jgi:ankyrin repeat protein